MDLIQLNFSENYHIRLKKVEHKSYIFCLIRKKWYLLTPEEWVRQHCIYYLIQEKKISKSAINAEVPISINGMKKRADILVYNKENPLLIVECKAPHIKITQETFDQIARYQIQLKAEYLMVSNGLNHYYAKIDYTHNKYIFLEDLTL